MSLCTQHRDFFKNQWNLVNFFVSNLLLQLLRSSSSPLCIKNYVDTQKFETQKKTKSSGKQAAILIDKWDKKVLNLF